MVACHSFRVVSVCKLEVLTQQKETYLFKAYLRVVSSPTLFEMSKKKSEVRSRFGSVGDDVNQLRVEGGVSLHFVWPATGWISTSLILTNKGTQLSKVCCLLINSSLQASLPCRVWKYGMRNDGILSKYTRSNVSVGSSFLIQILMAPRSAVVPVK